MPGPWGPPEPGKYLLHSANATGTALVSGTAVTPGVPALLPNAYLPGTADARQWGQKFLYLETSGNSASASIWAIPEIDTVSGLGQNQTPSAARALKITGWAQGPGTTATAFLTGYFPFLVAQVDWASGGANTGTVNLYVAGGPAPV